MRTEDGYIIQQCLDGDSASFGFLVEKYKKAVYALAYSKIGNFHDAQDITQEVFINAYRKLHTLRRWDNFMGWLQRITINQCKMILRARSKRPDREFMEDQEPETLDQSFINSYHEDILHKSIREALDSLPELYSQALTLRYFGGMTVKKMSGFLAVSPSTIDRRLREAQARLKEGMLAMMSISYKQHKLPANFTFRIVEMVKRIRIHPLPKTSGVPWGLSVATGLMLILLRFGSYTVTINPISVTVSPPLPDETAVMETGEMTIDLLKVSKLPYIASASGNGDGGLPGIPAQQNAVLMSPMGEGGKIPEEPSAQIGKGELLGIAYSPDGKIFAALTSAGVRLYDASNLNEVGILKEDKTYRINSIIFSSDGKILAVGDYYGGVSLWDMQTQKQIGSIPDGQGFPKAFSPDSRMLVMTDIWDFQGGNNNIQLWDTQKLERIGLMKGHTDDVCSIAFAPDGKTLASASDDKTIRLWDIQERRQVGLLNGNKNPVYTIAISPDGKILASGGGEGDNEGELLLWDIQERKLIGSLEGHKAQIGSVAFSSDGKTLFSACHQTIRIWDVQGQRQIVLLQPSKETGWYIALSPDGKTLASWSYIGQAILFWDIQERKQTDTIEGFTGSSFIAFRPNGRILASGGAKIIFWSVADQKKIGECTVIDYGLQKVAFSPDGEILAGYSYDRIIYLIDVNEQKLIGSLEGHTDNIRSIAFSPDGKFLASGSLDMTLRLWDVQQKKEVWKQNCPSHTHAVAFTPDGESLIVGIGGNGPIIIYDVKTKKQTDILQTPGWVYNLAVSPDGKLLASQLGDNTLIFWDLTNKRQLGTVVLGGDIWISRLMFSPDSRWLVSASEDGVCSIWDADTREELARLKGRIVNISFSPDGKWLATSGDGTIQLWEVDIPVEWKSVEPTGKLMGTWGEVKQTKLLQNYPNPFNPETWIPYQLSSATDVKITIHSSSGHLIRMLDIGHKPAGSYITRESSAYWDGRNEIGEQVASGVYFYSMEADDYSSTKKMTILR